MSRTVSKVRVPGSSAPHARQHIGHMHAPGMVIDMELARAWIFRFGTIGLLVMVALQRGGRGATMEPPLPSTNPKLCAPCRINNPVEPPVGKAAAPPPAASRSSSWATART